MISIIIILICGVLWRLGGWEKAKWSGYRDVLIPVIIGLWYCFTLRWWVGILTAGSFNIIRLGSGAYDPVNDPEPSFLARITRDQRGIIIRMLYGFITSFIGGITVALYTKEFMFFGLYILANIIIEGLLTWTKARDYIHESLVGIARAELLLCR